MRARQTSIDCYNQIVAEGLLSKRRLQVYAAMLVKAPCTAGELEQYMNQRYGVKGGWKLLSIMREQGVLYETEIRPCGITGRNVIEWDLTDNLPTAVKPVSNTKKERVEKTVKAVLDLSEKDIISDADWLNVIDLIKEI